MSLHLLHIINKCSCFSNLTFLHIIKTNLYLHVHVCQSHISICILSYICIYIIRRAINTTPNILKQVLAYKMSKCSNQIWKENIFLILYKVFYYHHRRTAQKFFNFFFIITAFLDFQNSFLM